MNGATIFVINKKDIRDYYDLTVHNQMNHVKHSDIATYLKNNLKVVVNLENNKINYVSLTNAYALQKQSEVKDKASGSSKSEVKYESLCDIMVMKDFIEYEMRLEEVLEKQADKDEQEGQIMQDGQLKRVYKMNSEYQFKFQHLRVVVTQATKGKKRKVLRLAQGTEQVIKPELYESFLQMQIEIVVDDKGNFDKIIQHRALDGWWLIGKDYFKYLMKKHGCKNMV